MLKEQIQDALRIYRACEIFIKINYLAFFPSITVRRKINFYLYVKFVRAVEIVIIIAQINVNE